MVDLCGISAPTRSVHSKVAAEWCFTTSTNKVINVLLTIYDKYINLFAYSLSDFMARI